jgi:ATP-dependent RNA helicase RhlE
MGFVHDMRQILSEIAQPRQAFFFSATVDSKVSSLIREFSNNPVTISVKTGITVDTVEQNIVTYGSNSQKVNKLHDLLIGSNISKALVFDDTQRSVEKLSKELQLRGFLADAIHGGKSQGQRQRALNKFKSNEVNILVATDVAARGIDVSDISHVINYSTPQTYDDYVHRIGRAGRAGKTGYALTFIEN